MRGGQSRPASYGGVTDIPASSPASEPERPCRRSWAAPACKLPVRHRDKPHYGGRSGTSARSPGGSGGRVIRCSGTSRPATTTAAASPPRTPSGIETEMPSDAPRSETNSNHRSGEVGQRQHLHPEGHPDARQQRSEGAEHRERADHRLHQHVRQDRQHSHVAGQRDDQRGGEQERGGGDRERLGGAPAASRAVRASATSAGTARSGRRSPTPTGRTPCPGPMRANSRSDRASRRTARAAPVFGGRSTPRAGRSRP